MSLKKQYLKTKPVCKVTFSLPGVAVGCAANVTLVGDFNNWSYDATTMKKSRNGSFSVTIELEIGKEYQFRYLVDGFRWENDWEADKYVPTAFGDSENSVVVV